MVGDFLVEFFAQHNEIRAITWKVLLHELARIPDSSFSHKVEAGLMNDRRYRSMRIGSKKDRGSEDSLKCANQSTVLGAALLHSESVEHLRCAGERDPARSLPVRQRSQEQRNEPILPPRQSVVGMPGYEEDKLAVATFMD
jgi:hypothetical protein